MLRRDFLKAALITSGGLAGGVGLASGRPPALHSALQDDFEPGYLKLERTGELARRDSQLWQILGKCTLCPRKCQVKRLAGEVKICRTDYRLKVASYGAHFGEEEPLVGTSGSGTIFFSNCNLLCVFCQNWEIAHRGAGHHLTFKQLAKLMVALQKRGCHNINLVTPSHFVPHIVRALRYAVGFGLRLPLVYNTGGYDRVETLRLLDGIIDIYLPDFKYTNGDMAHKYSAEARDYPQVAAAAIKEMYRQVGDLACDSRGVAKRGLMVRHLVMPNNVSGTDAFVRWVARELSPRTYVNLMAQYRPEYKARDFPEINRRLTASEWRQALAWARQAGLQRLAG